MSEGTKAVTVSTISAQAAGELVTSAARKAAEIGIPMCIAVADHAGELKAFLRMDGAKLLAVGISQNKAYTAVSFGLSTDGWYDFIKEDGPLAHRHRADPAPCRVRRRVSDPGGRRGHRRHRSQRWALHQRHGGREGGTGGQRVLGRLTAPGTGAPDRGTCRPGPCGHGRDRLSGCLIRCRTPAWRRGRTRWRPCCSASPAATPAVPLRGSRGERWTHGDLDAASARLAHLLTGIGVRPGDRVAVQTEKSADVIALHVACARAGAVYLPLNPAYTDREVRGLLTDAEPALLVRDDPIDVDCPRVTLPALVEQAARRPATYDDVARALQDPAALLYTSGTTGRPKGAMLSHGNLAVQRAGAARRSGASPPTTCCCTRCRSSTSTACSWRCTARFLTGAPMIFLPTVRRRRGAAALPRATVMMGVPTYYTRLLADPGFDARAAPHMRLFISGSAPLLGDRPSRVRASAPARRILERYGMTETA